MKTLLVPMVFVLIAAVAASGQAAAATRPERDVLGRGHQDRSRVVSDPGDLGKPAAATHSTAPPFVPPRQAAARSGLSVAIDDSARALPHFNPDLEEPAPRGAVRWGFGKPVRTRTAILLAVPEYAFGIPGAFKNALDWTVGSGSIYRKPVALLSVAPLGGRRKAFAMHFEFVFTALDCEVSYHSVPVTPCRSRPGRRTPRSGRIADELLRVLEALAGSRARSVRAALSHRSGISRHTSLRTGSRSAKRRCAMATAVHTANGAYELDKTSFDGAVLATTRRRVVVPRILHRHRRPARHRERQRRAVGERTCRVHIDRRSAGVP